MKDETYYTLRDKTRLCTHIMQKTILFELCIYLDSLY